MRRATSSIHTSEIKILLNILLITLVLTFINVESLIMLMLFLAAGYLHGPCGQPGTRGQHVGDPALGQPRNLNIHS